MNDVRQNSGALVPVQAGVIAREEFSGSQVQKLGETAAIAVAARERAVVEARYLMAERHPRNWSDVRIRMLNHCERPGFAEKSRYSKPVGKELINGEWVEKKAKGFTIRFAETLAQEMRNVAPEVSVTFEDDLIRIVRISVTDFEANLPWSREVTIPKAVEKRGFKNKRSGEWEPPDGREVLGSRLNSRGEMTYLVKATDDELRSKVNSESSKTHRDFLAKLCPRDILEECEEKVAEVLSAAVKKDPTKARKKLLDRFHEVGVMPSDLVTYVGKPEDRWTLEDVEELIALGSAIRDGETTFTKAMELRYSSGNEEGGAEETQAQHDARLKRQAEEQLRAVQEREAAQQQHKEPPMGDSGEMSEEESRALDAKLAAEERAAAQKTEAPKVTPPKFGRPR